MFWLTCSLPKPNKCWRHNSWYSLREHVWYHREFRSVYKRWNCLVRRIVRSSWNRTPSPSKTHPIVSPKVVWVNMRYSSSPGSTCAWVWESRIRLANDIFHLCVEVSPLNRMQTSVRVTIREAAWGCHQSCKVWRRIIRIRFNCFQVAARNPKFVVHIKPKGTATSVTAFIRSTRLRLGFFCLVKLNSFQLLTEELTDDRRWALSHQLNVHLWSSL
jgi:hypothetical protein